MSRNNSRRLFISFVEPDVLEGKLNEIGVDRERDHLLVRKVYLSQVKNFFSSASSFGNAFNYLSILSVGLLVALVRLRPEEIVFIFRKSKTELRIIANIIRFVKLLKFEVKIGLVDLDNEFWLEGVYHYQLVQGNPILDLLICGILFFPVLVILPFSVSLALVYPGVLLVAVLAQVLNMTYFKTEVKTELRGLYRSRLEFSASSCDEHSVRDDILWLDLKYLNYAEFYSFPGCQLNTDEDKRIFGYHLTEKGVRCVAGVDDSRSGEIAILGASFSYGMYIDEGKTLADLIQRKLPQHRIVNLSFAKGCNAVTQYFQLDSIFEEYQNLHTVVVFITDFWQNLQLPDYTTIFKNLQAHDLPLYYRKKGKLHIAGDFILKPCIMHELYLGKLICKALLWIYRKFVFSDSECVKIDEVILQKMREKCVNEGKELLVAVGNRAHYLEEFLHNNGFNWVDATKIGNNEHIEEDPAKWNLALDHGRHPGEEAHALMAENIYAGLSELVNCRSAEKDFVSNKTYYKPEQEELDVYPLF